MAYTYDDFLKVANNAKMLNQFDPKDLEVTKANPEYGLSMLRLMQDSGNASSPEARLLANEAINQLRTNYNVSSLGTGGTYSPATDVNDDAAPSAPTEENGTGSSSFQYGREDEYQQLLDQIANPPDFQYDPEQDPAWSAFRKAYLREGDRAVQDALARASATTGGVPSSYAVMAAQQAGANYAEQLNDRLPTLEQNAYQRYLNDQSLRQMALQAIEADRADAYGKWIDEYKKLQQNIQQGGADGMENTSGLSENDLAFLKALFPTGNVQNKADWDQLVAWYGEDALRAAGYSYYDQSSAGGILGSIAGTVGRLVGGIPGIAGAVGSLVGGIPGIEGNGAILDHEDIPWDGHTITGVDLKTLSSMGYEGYPEEAIAKLVEAGMLEEYVVDGVVQWRLGPNNRTDSGEARYSPSDALKWAVTRGT